MENNKITNKEKGCSKLFKLLTIIILSISILFASNILEKNVVFADSGFDFSYDSGGSSDWGSSSSDWGSSSSSSWGGSSYSSSSGSMDDDSWVGLIIIFIIIVVAIAITSSKNNKQLTSTPIASNVNDETIANKIKQHLPNFDKKVFMEDTYKIYLDVQNAWMNFKLDDVRSKITDEMFNMYQSQLDTLEVKGEQNIMKNFKLVSSYLKDVSVQNENITVTACYVIDFYDYIIEKSTGKVLRGSASNKMRVTYDMKFRKTLNEKLSINHCPNCGAKIEQMNGAGVCEFCGSKIVSENLDWVLTDKKTINQRRAQ